MIRYRCAHFINLMTNASLVVIAMVAISFMFGLRFNLSGSMPIGIYHAYHAVDIKRGNWVAVCLPKPMAQHGLERGYLMKGLCPAYTAPVVKEVFALPNDVLKRRGDFVIRNHNAIVYAPLSRFDRNKKALNKAAINEHQKLTGYWLYGSNSPIHSWDSRYFGVVSLDSVLYQVKPLWVKNLRRYPPQYPPKSNSIPQCATHLRIKKAQSKKESG